MEPIQILHDWGWAGVLVWLMYRELWPFVREKLFPAYIDARKRQDAERARERERLEKLEERQVASFEKIAESQNGIASAIKAIESILAVNTERLGVIQSTMLDYPERQRMIEDGEKKDEMDTRGDQAPRSPA